MPNIGKDDHPKLWSLIFVLIIALTFCCFVMGQGLNSGTSVSKEKGVDVKVQTAASGTYEQTLKSEIAKTEAPTLFQVNGPVG